MTGPSHPGRPRRLRTTRAAQGTVVAVGLAGALGVAGAIGAGQLLTGAKSTADGSQSPAVQQPQSYQVQVLPAQRSGERDDDEGTRVRLVPVTPQRQQPPSSGPTAPQPPSHATTSGS
ncbi:MAG: hypothetical protein R2731_15325 [Nocardioides sp.]